MARRSYEADTELVNLESLFNSLADIFFKRDSSREFPNISWSFAPHGIVVVFTDSLYPGKEFSKVIEREKVIGLQISGINAREIAEQILNHDGKQAERDIASAERRFIEKTKTHPTGEVLLRILDELKKLNKNRGE